MKKKLSKTEEYIKALEEELEASMLREEKLIKDGVKTSQFIKRKAQSTKLYALAKDPDSKIGKVIRSPRTIYRLIRHRKEISQKKTQQEKLVEITHEHLLEPWKMSLDERKALAEDALRAGKKLALYYVDKVDSSTSRYRCFNTLEATKQSDKWQAVFFIKKEEEDLLKLIPQASIVILGRQTGQEKKIREIIKYAHENKKEVSLDIDDLVFDMEYLDLVLNSIGDGQNRGYWQGYFADIRKTAEAVDSFIVTNDFLKEKIKESFRKPCAVIRNALNDGQINASRAYWLIKKNNPKFRIGYFSGSPTHAKDFAVAEPDIIRFLNDYKDSELIIVGYMRFSPLAKKLIAKGRIKFVPPVDFRKLQRLISSVDVNIAPLVINDFTNCKSELKYFESALVKTVTIASPSFTFKNAIKDGKNGLLAEPGEWYEKIKYLYEHPQEREKIAENAYKHSIENYSGAVFVKEIEDTYDQLSK